ncbi:MAG: DinB family protein [Ignavibacteria bacterium]|nr:DinB family protein [Ignavibacteria bacterium]
MNNSINRISYLIDEIPVRIKSVKAEILSKKPAPDKWSKKEILGHLCDSAVNNLSRFIRAQFEPEPFKVIPYAQNEWVELNNYQKMDIEAILVYWVTLNKQIVHIVSNISEAKLGVVCNLGNAAFREGEIEKNLLWLFEDYLIHMEYHLRQIIEDDWLRGDYMSRN